MEEKVIQVLLYQLMVHFLCVYKKCVSTSRINTHRKKTKTTFSSCLVSLITVLIQSECNVQAILLGDSFSEVL